jgi:hypothetical protein
MPRVAFIVTSCVNTKKQLDLFFECILSISNNHPDAHIQVLDDSSRTDCLSVPEFCKIEKTKHHGCGEVNAYIWAMDHRNEYDLFIYLHDSCKVLKRVPYDLKEQHYKQFWYAGFNSHLDTTGEKIDKIMEIFTVSGKDCKHELGLVRNGQGNLVFGGMAAFDPVFLTFLETQTNFKDIAGLLHGRPMRCFFERLLYIILYKFTGIHTFFYNSFCGDIFNHTNGFQNDSFEIDPNNPYIVKVWQFR